MSKTKIILFLGILLLIVAFLFSKNYNSEIDEKNNQEIFENEKKEIIFVAACPTFHYVLDSIKEIDGISVIKTETTSESIELLKKRDVDIVVSGRALKNTEPNFKFEIIENGYDFVFREETIIFEEEMQSVIFYTNLDENKIINDFKNISKDNLVKIDNIDDYLNENIVITHLDNRMKGESVHILKKDGTRVPLSRKARIYYLSLIEKDFLDLIKEYF